MKKLKDMWDRLQERMKEERKFEKAMRELYSMSDKELNDIGISRYDIPRIVRWG